MKGITLTHRENDLPSDARIIRVRTVEESKAARKPTRFIFPAIVAVVIIVFTLSILADGGKWTHWLWAGALGLVGWAALSNEHAWAPQRNRERWNTGTAACGSCGQWPMTDRNLVPENKRCGSVLVGSDENMVPLKCDREWPHVAQPHASMVFLGVHGVYKMPVLVQWWGDRRQRDRVEKEWDAAFKAKQAADALDATPLVGLFGESLHGLNVNAMHVRCGVCMGRGLPGVVEYGDRAQSDAENDAARETACYAHRDAYHPGAPCAFIEDRVATVPVNFRAISEMCPNGCGGYDGKCASETCPPPRYCTFCEGACRDECENGCNAPEGKQGHCSGDVLMLLRVPRKNDERLIALIEEGYDVMPVTEGEFAALLSRMSITLCLTNEQRAAWRPPRNKRAEPLGFTDGYYMHVVDPLGRVLKVESDEGVLGEGGSCVIHIGRAGDCCGFRTSPGNLRVPDHAKDPCIVCQSIRSVLK